MSKTPPRRKPSDPHASEHFQSTSIAYQTLPVPALRSKYNEFDTRESATESVFVDPEEVFGKIFGWERFVGVIGHISLARDTKAALQEAKEREEGEGKVIRDGNSVVSEEERTRKKTPERALAGTERFTQFSTNLECKLGIFTESATGINDVDVMMSWRTICELEADVSTLRATLDLKSVFDQIQAAEKAGNLSPNECQNLEEQAAEKGLQALFEGAKLAVELALREVV
ncbi:hypothetical protein F5051DRAFT_505590 [Lentinula edodes]|nr:hypothetical protein F5051DRAFT_505590 [Lentinula edodes]